MSENNFSHSYNFFLVRPENQYSEVKYQEKWEKNRLWKKDYKKRYLRIARVNIGFNIILGQVRKIKIIRHVGKTMLKINTFQNLTQYLVYFKEYINIYTF